jgi:cell wall-associated NlpC family hydrolase
MDQILNALIAWLQRLFRDLGVSGLGIQEGQQTGESLGARAAGLAEQEIGVAYQWGGTSPLAFDCSGLVQWSFAQAGYTLPRTAAQQSEAVQPVAVGDLQRGDLVFYSFGGVSVDHVGIYLGNDIVLNANGIGGKVMNNSLSGWMPWLTSAGRVA